MYGFTYLTFIVAFQNIYLFSHAIFGCLRQQNHAYQVTDSYASSRPHCFPSLRSAEVYLGASLALEKLMEPSQLPSGKALSVEACHGISQGKFLQKLLINNDFVRT